MFEIMQIVEVTHPNQDAARAVVVGAADGSHIRVVILGGRLHVDTPGTTPSWVFLFNVTALTEKQVASAEQHYRTQLGQIRQAYPRVGSPSHQHSLPT